VDPVPDPLLLRKSGSSGNPTRDPWICSQKLKELNFKFEIITAMTMKLLSSGIWRRVSGGCLPKFADAASIFMDLPRCHVPKDNNFLKKVNFDRVIKSIRSEDSRHNQKLYPIPAHRFNSRDYHSH
jgi:hypothetical protein